MSILLKVTTNWRAGCKKSACPVRREGRSFPSSLPLSAAQSLPLPLPEKFSLLHPKREKCALALLIGLGLAQSYAEARKPGDQARYLLLQRPAAGAPWLRVEFGAIAIRLIDFLSIYCPRFRKRSPMPSSVKIGGPLRSRGNRLRTRTRTPGLERQASNRARVNKDFPHHPASGTDVSRSFSPHRGRVRGRVRVRLSRLRGGSYSTRKRI